jgi:hypothetical protein
MNDFDRAPRLHPVLTILADLGFVWVIIHFGMGGVANAWVLLTNYGLLPWVILGLVGFLVLYRSDYRTDVALFLSGYLLGYWGEWWGTSRGVWTYWDGSTPPLYLPPLWGIGLLTVYRLSSLILPKLQPNPDRLIRWSMLASFLILPLLAFAHSWPSLVLVDWRGRLDYHFIAGILVAGVLILYRFDLRETFVFFICGTILGGTYEYLGTSWGEWRYITGEVPPLWIAPLWGFATVAMVKLARFGVRLPGLLAGFGWGKASQSQTLRKRP